MNKITHAEAVKLKSVLAKHGGLDMYTYEKFVTDGSFTLMRPIFYTLLILAILLFLI